MQDSDEQHGTATTSYLESALLSRCKVNQQVLCVHRSNCPPDARPLTYKTHVVTLANPNPSVRQQRDGVEAAHQHEATGGTTSPSQDPTTNT